MIWTNNFDFHFKCGGKKWGRASQFLDISRTHLQAWFFYRQAVAPKTHISITSYIGTSLSRPLSIYLNCLMTSTETKGLWSHQSTINSYFWESNAIMLYWYWKIPFENSLGSKSWAPITENRILIRDQWAEKHFIARERRHHNCSIRESSSLSPTKLVSDLEFPATRIMRMK